MSTYLVCFDISDDRLRNRVGHLLGEYGRRVQRSVFEINVRRAGEIEILKAKLNEETGEDNDIRFYRLCANCRNGSEALDGDQIADFPAVIIV